MAALLASPGFDDPALTDRTHQPYVTIDGPLSRDLDQAIFVARAPRGGFVVEYAIADAAHFVPPRSALFREALARGASYYFPGFSVPMLPRELSEGLVSLNPRVVRRALVFEMYLDDDGNLLRTELVRARIRSREKLSFGEVQELYDAPRDSRLSGSPSAESLRLLREVGLRRIAIAEREDVVRYRRREVEVKTAGDDLGFVVLEAVRDQVELYNEQISILCNREAGRLLAEHPAPHLQPIYRVHPAPSPDSVGAFRELVRTVVREHGAPPDAAIRDGEAVSAYLRRLPDSARNPAMARAIERQAILLNVRSAFSTDPSLHHGVGAEVYARASAPMREVVGVFLHKELCELALGAPPESSEVDGELRLTVVAAANEAREKQRRVNDAVNRLVLDRIFTEDAARGALPRRGVVMGITSSKVHVELDDPGLDVKVYLRDLGQSRGGAWLEATGEGAALRVKERGDLVCRLGDEVSVTLLGRDARRDRWKLGLAAIPGARG